MTTRRLRIMSTIVLRLGRLPCTVARLGTHLAIFHHQPAIHPKWRAIGRKHTHPREAQALWIHTSMDTPLSAPHPMAALLMSYIALCTALLYNQLAAWRRRIWVKPR